MRWLCIISVAVGCGTTKTADTRAASTTAEREGARPSPEPGLSQAPVAVCAVRGELASRVPLYVDGLQVAHVRGAVEARFAIGSTNAFVIASDNGIDLQAFTPIATLPLAAAAEPGSMLRTTTARVVHVAGFTDITVELDVPRGVVMMSPPRFVRRCSELRLTPRTLAIPKGNPIQFRGELVALRAWRDAGVGAIVSVDDITEHPILLERGDKRSKIALVSRDSCTRNAVLVGWAANRHLHFKPPADQTIECGTLCGRGTPRPSTTHRCTRDMPLLALTKRGPLRLGTIRAGTPIDVLDAAPSEVAPIDPSRYQFLEGNLGVGQSSLDRHCQPISATESELSVRAPCSRP